MVANRELSVKRSHLLFVVVENKKLKKKLAKSEKKIEELKEALRMRPSNKGPICLACGKPIAECGGCDGSC